MRIRNKQHSGDTTNLVTEKRFRSASADGGFTFIEVMVAISILAIVITALVGLMNMSTQMAVRAENKARLTDAISQLADRLRAMPYADAGKTLTYVSTEGDIVMNLTVTPSAAGSSSIKTIKIEGYSTRLDPNNTQKATVILRSSTYENDGEAAFADPPVITNFSLAPAIGSQPVDEGKAVAGALKITVSAKTGSTEATLLALRVYVGSEVVGEVIDPNNNGSYAINWDSTAADEQNVALFQDGRKRIVLEAVDNLGGQARSEKYVYLDNIPVTTTFPDQVVVVSEGPTVNITWNQIADPDGSGNGAARYYVVLLQKDKHNKVTRHTPQTITASSITEPTPTTTSFKVSYDKKDKFNVYIYPMCPDGCAHETPYSTKFLKKIGFEE